MVNGAVVVAPRAKLSYVLVISPSLPGATLSPMHLFWNGSIGSGETQGVHGDLVSAMSYSVMVIEGP
jgi:hypothetical protein